MSQRIPLPVWVAAVLLPQTSGNLLSAELPFRAMVLRADGAVVWIGVSDGGRKAEIVNPIQPTTISEPGYALDVDQGGERIVALLPQGWDSVQDLVRINGSSQKVEKRIRLDPKRRYSGISIGRQSRRVYLFSMDEQGAAYLSIAEFESLTISRDVRIRSSDGKTWRPYQGLVAPDESFAAVSYHGPDTSGLDLIPLGTDTALVEPVHFPTAHGGLRWLNGHLLASAAGPALLKLTTSGEVAGAFDSGIDESHLMEFAVLSERREIVACGPCTSAGPGLSFISFDAQVGAAAGASTWMPTPRRRPRLFLPGVCGERVASRGDSIGVLQWEAHRLKVIGASDKKLWADIDVGGSPVDAILLPALPGRR